MIAKDLLLNTFSYLCPPEDLVRIARVCKEWNSSIDNPIPWIGCKIKEELIEEFIESKYFKYIRVIEINDNNPFFYFLSQPIDLNNNQWLEELYIDDAFEYEAPVLVGKLGEDVSSRLSQRQFDIKYDLKNFNLSSFPNLRKLELTLHYEYDIELNFPKNLKLTALKLNIPKYKKIIDLSNNTELIELELRLDAYNHEIDLSSNIKLQTKYIHM